MFSPPQCNPQWSVLWQAITRGNYVQQRIPLIDWLKGFWIDNAFHCDPGTRNDNILIRQITDRLISVNDPLYIDYIIIVIGMGNIPFTSWVALIWKHTSRLTIKADNEQTVRIIAFTNYQCLCHRTCNALMQHGSLGMSNPIKLVVIIDCGLNALRFNKTGKQIVSLIIRGCVCQF